LKFFLSKFLRLISDKPDVEVSSPEGLYVGLPEVITIVSEYDDTPVYPEYGLSKLDTNMKGVTTLLGVGMNTTILSELSKNRIVEV
jgi:hypothetical protein